jgi:hypothetical protein
MKPMNSCYRAVQRLSESARVTEGEREGERERDSPNEFLR